MNVPAKLHSADIKRFAHRAAQVESFKPPVAYWCYYWIVQQILGNGLHNADDAAKAFTTNLMDRLEEMKVKYADDDAIIDDVAGQAYVEQFGLETFQRAENAVVANKATKQTADTFQASATFLELVNIWGTPSPDIMAKIKYAKFHALRIAKTINAGQDPNLSNPVPSPEPASGIPALDPNDPEVRQINGADSQPSIAEDPVLHDQGPQDVKPDPALGAQIPPPLDSIRATSPPISPLVGHQQPTVTDVPDEHDRLQRNLASQSSLNESLHPSRAPSIPRPQPAEPGEQSQNRAASNANLGSLASHTLASTSASPHLPSTGPEPRESSSEGGYFPSVTLPDAPSDPQNPGRASSGAMSPTGYVERTVSSAASNNPQTFYGSPPALSHTSAAPVSPPLLSPQPPQQHTLVTPHHPQMPPQPQMSPQPQMPYQPHMPTQYQIPPHPNAPQSYLTDDAAVLAAQKHAKFAISALNFEDVPTAVKELREALKSLGAS